MTDANEQSIPSRGSTEHHGSPEPTAHLPNTVDAGCRSRESDAGTGDIMDRLDAAAKAESDRRRSMLTDEERITILAMACFCDTRDGSGWRKSSAILRGLLDRTK